MVMKRLIPATIVLLTLLSSISIKAQSFEEQLKIAENAKNEYGEKDDRYLDALSKAIATAFAEKKNEEANKYRQIHADIVKKKYGENSLEYAEDLWRLGNVSGFMGDAYTFECYKKAAGIYESNKAESEFPYCDIMMRLYEHYSSSKNYILAADYLKKFIAHHEFWITNKWKGGYFTLLQSAHAHLLLGDIYCFKLNDLISSTSFYEKCVSILEDNALLKDYSFSIRPYQCLALIYTQLRNYSKAISWQKRLLNTVQKLKGDTSIDYLTELENLAYKYFSNSDYNSSKSTFETLLSQVKKRDSEMGLTYISDSLYTRALNHLVSVCIAFHDNGVIEYAPQLLDVYSKTGKGVSEDYLETLGSLILSYDNTGDFLSAYGLFGKYEELANRLGLKQSEEYCDFLRIKVEVLTHLFKTDECNIAINELSELTSVLFGNNSFNSLLLAYQKADRLESLGQFEAAQKGVEDCFNIMRSNECHFESSTDSVFIMASLHDLEGRFFTSSDPQRAETLFLNSISEFNSIGASQVGPFVNLGVFYFQQKRDYKKAISYFEQSKNLLEKIGDRSSIKYITVLNDLALCYHNLGANSAAIAVFDLANQTVLTNYGKQHPLYGTTVQNKAVFFINIGDFPSAIECCKESLSCYENVYGKESAEYATCLQNLGLVYQYLGDYSVSKQILSDAIPILEHCNNPNLINAYTNLLVTYVIDKDFDAAASLIDKAESLIKENNWNNTDVAANLYGSIGYALSLYNNPEAQNYFAYALKCLEESGAKSSLAYYKGLVAFGMSKFIDNTQSEEIIPPLVSGYKLQYLNNVAFFNSSERESLISGPQFSQIKDVLFSSRQTNNQDKWLYDFLLFNKGLLLGTKLGYAKAIFNSGNDEIIDKYKEFQSLTRYINGERIALKDSFSLDEVKSKVSVLEREITSWLKDNGGFVDELNFSYENVKSSLKESEIAIEFINYYDYLNKVRYYAALVAGKNLATPIFVKICKQSDLERLASISPDKLYGETAVSVEAYNNIWTPLLPLLQSAKTIYFSPSGYISKMAIEHLYDGEKRFEDIYSVFRLSSTRELCKMRQDYKYSSAVLYGGLNYDEDDLTMISESRKIKSTPSSSPVFRGTGTSTAHKGWNYLPGTMEEVRQISSIINKSKVQCILFTSERGNEESFKALSGRGINLLHIATHGFYVTESQAERNDFFSSNPFSSQTAGKITLSMQRSGLLLSGGNKAWKGEVVPEGVEDGVLTAAEISELDFNSCNIVVLSACETGLGDITDEGVLGLQRAFKNAGVNTIIMSLWEVDDAATSLMMQSFYTNLLKGKSKRDSFIIAQNEVKKIYSDPRYWAAFIMLD